MLNIVVLLVLKGVSIHKVSWLKIHREEAEVLERSLSDPFKGHWRHKNRHGDRKHM